MATKTESVKLDSELIDRVRELAREQRRTIRGKIELLIERGMREETQPPKKKRSA